MKNLALHDPKYTLFRRFIRLRFEIDFEPDTDESVSRLTSEEILQDRSALDYRGKIADEASWQTSRVKNEINTVAHGRTPKTKGVVVAIGQQLANQDNIQLPQVRENTDEFIRSCFSYQ